MSNRRIRLLAYNVRSLWNVGAFFRTADAFNIEHLYLTGYTGHPPRKEITKTAIGAEQWIPWEHHRDPMPVIRQLKKDGWQILSLELAPGAVALPELEAADNVCLIVGHELTGVPDEIIRECDRCVMIPMLGQKESINVSVAAGIAMYALRHVSS